MSKQFTPTMSVAQTYCYVPVREVRNSEELGRYVTYGMSACRQTENGLETLRYISDISIDGEAVRQLAQACTVGSLDPVHFPEVIEDFLAS